MDSKISVTFAARSPRGNLKITVFGNTTASVKKTIEDLCATLDAVPDTPPAPSPSSSTPPPAPTVKCPACDSDCWDNRANRKPDDKRPLIKCQNVSACGWILWQNPRTEKEKKDATLFRSAAS